MKIVIAGIALVAAASTLPLAVHAHTHAAPAGAQTIHVTGEVVDTGCYLAHGARGAKHKECADKCVSNGMPMGLLTNDGKLYLLTPNHTDTDAYSKLRSMVAENVTVTGTLLQRNGMTAIDVTGATPAKTAAK